MKKLIISIVVSVLSISALAKGSSKLNDDSHAIGNCMVQIDDSKSKRFINVAYIKSIDVTQEDGYDYTKPNILNIRMASNYSSRSSYSIDYGTEQKALEELKILAIKINNCGN